jgi:hypothetical protein
MTDTAETITVKVGKVPGRMQFVDLPANGATVGMALGKAGITDDEDYQLRVNLTPVEKDQVLQDGQAVLLLKKVKGNRQ